MSLSLKKTQRSAVLKLLKKDLTQSDRTEQSKLLCERILERISKGFFTRTCSSPLSLDSAKCDLGLETRTLHVCSFLPMYFEPDLLGVMRGLWARMGSSNNNNLATNSGVNCGYRVYVPRMARSSDVCNKTGIDARDSEVGLAQSNIMHFVEVFDESDLASSFSPQGKYKIVEINPSVWEAECVSRAVVGSTSATTGKSVGRVRRVLGHAPPAPELFSQCLAPQEKCVLHEVEAERTSPPLHRHHVLLLCPAAAFDERCGRIGKGAGYYDRFIEGLLLQQDDRQNDLVRDPRSTNHKNATNWSFTTLGVGFDEQIVKEVAMETHDIHMDEVITPHFHFVRESRRE